MTLLHRNYVTFPRSPGYRVLALVCSLGPFQIAQAEKIEASTGAELANRTCAACHDVSPHEVPAAPGIGGASVTPSFAWIASKHPEYLNGVIVRPSYEMEGLYITPIQAAELRAYFDTLRNCLPRT